ncbi:MAG TPA: GAF domain-containing sensor histidine kinase [Candidatus Eremiobacteraceae bacterium]|nr:GAF domain-containing sensor histidine kinase [Candidatus Eremiobacteraceae bacterium]
MVRATRRCSTSHRASRKDSDAGAIDRRTRELEILNAIAQALNETNDVRSALERTLALVTDLVGLRSGWVWLLDPDTSQFYSAATYRLPPYLQEPVRMSGSWCICTDGLRSGELMSKNVDVIECSRLSPAVQRRATALTAGLRFHASVPLRFQDKPIGVMNVTGPQWRKLTKDELGLLSTIGLQVGAMIERARLAESQARLARAEERTRVARELHDTLLQSLTAIALQLEGASRDPNASQALRERLGRSIESARSSAADARRAIADLRTSHSVDKPLAQALAALARSFMSETGVAVRVVASPEVVLPRQVEAELYRIAQEALTNIRKHARAKSVMLTLRRAKGSVRLAIADDGIGMERARKKGEGHGLRGMSERSALIGGSLALTRRRGGGTTVTVTLPVETRR